MGRPTIFEAAGGEPAFLALATAHHQRCVEDEVLNHPFSHPGNPDHVQRLAWYWAEVLGGPPRFSEYRALRAYMTWATAEVMSYDPPEAVVPTTAPMPRWSWDGLVVG